MVAIVAQCESGLTEPHRLPDRRLFVAICPQMWYIASEVFHERFHSRPKILVRDRKNQSESRVQEHSRSNRIGEFLRTMH